MVTGLLLVLAEISAPPHDNTVDRALRLLIDEVYMCALKGKYEMYPLVPPVLSRGRGDVASAAKCRIPGSDCRPLYGAGEGVTAICFFFVLQK